jgi:RimJ/RimL family protein N-acetyltransferase
MDRIVTERLVLRRAREEDLEAMHEVLSHPLATRYWSTPPHDSLEQTREWLAAMMEDAPGERDDYLIEREGRVIGKAGCFRLPEIGYILHPGHWGQGLATEALQAVIPRIFARHPIEALRADVDPRNIRSIRLLERLGFAVSGRASRTWHVGGEWCDSVYLTLPRPGHMAE